MTALDLQLETGPDEADAPEADLLARIAASYQVVRGSARTRRVTYLDTFDFRLHERGLVLTGDASRWELRHLASDELVARGPGRCEAPCTFAEELSAGPLRDRLERLAGIRALLPIARIESHVEPLRVCNDDEKTVARLAIEDARVVGRRDAASLGRWLRVRAVRGYDRDAGRLVAIAREAGAVAGDGSSPAEHPFLLAARAAGRAPGRAAELILSPDAPARAAVAAVLRGHLETVRRNERGVIADIDTEFLHDLRVALRKMRSILGQVRGVLPQDEVDRLRAALGTAARVTGPLRDVDVHLLGRAAVESLLPDVLRPGLSAFFDEVAAGRRTALEAVRTELRSERWADLLARSESLLQRAIAPGDGEVLADTEWSAAPVSRVARRTLRRLLRKVLEDGARIDAATPDARLHDLRIRCKKLRYALEAFGSLLPGEDRSAMTRQLKGLQSVLGTFNDLCVQGEVLRERLERIEPGEVALAAALGGLATALDGQRGEVRRRYQNAFDQFRGDLGPWTTHIGKLRRAK